ncbi:spore coat protein YlbD [Anaerobacillus sp. MEB173]|uniref:spore coat protein YlbD n=1 Tax=Anaerobacillus sp. MEB173 TaxID=3383345 RepID=UPI003F8E9F63
MGKGSSLHPTVEEFKKFVKEHPLLIKEVRENRKTWQELYEDWMILGEDDTSWESYKREAIGKQEEKVKTDETDQVNQESLANLFSMFKKLNINDIQYHLSQFNGLVSNINGIIQQFQSDKSQQQQRGQENPLSFRKD